MSELARQLIAENKETQAKSLDLGNCGLTDLEKEVPELFECLWFYRLLCALVDGKKRLLRSIMRCH